MSDIPRIIDLGVRKFRLGQVVITPAAMQFLESAGASPLDLIIRHAKGDWGDVGREDWQANEQAIKDGDRLLSVFVINADQKVWIITEADRSSTCILLPDDY